MRPFNKSLLLAATLAVAVLACKKDDSGGTVTPPAPTEKVFPYQVNLVDPQATFETKALFYNLKANAGKGILFGQQDATMHGVGWKGQPDRSDIKSVTGQHPAVYGWDFWEIVRTYLGYSGTNADDPGLIKKATEDAYNRGGINTFCWHMQNFVTGKDFYDTTRCVKEILPGGTKHDVFKRSLDIIAQYVQSLKSPAVARLGNRPHRVTKAAFCTSTGSWFPPLPRAA